MSSVNDRLLDLARRNAERYVRDPNVRAILVTGSVAVGTADENSDVDVILYLNRPADQAFFDRELALAEANDGALYAGTPEEGFGLYRYDEGVKCDFGFGTVAETDQLITDVLETHDMELVKQQIIAGIRASIPLHGASIIEAWKSRTDAYPDGLGDKMIQHHLRVVPIWILRTMGAARGDRLFLTESFLDTTRRLLGVLYGLNRVYHPNKLKGAGSLIDTLEPAPADLRARLTVLYERPPDVAVDELERLVLDVYDLVDAHAPGVDTGPARAHFRTECVKR